MEATLKECVAMTITQWVVASIGGRDHKIKTYF